MGANEKLAATFHPNVEGKPATFDCEMCGDTYTSMRAAVLCEDRDIAEDKDARRPVRSVMRPASYWVED